eukprot:c24698_g1_i1.p1 GENE.c24698_g1_i1~~c24698_g1_i1.p1  ORF type:complete len:115 (+),score=21.73 c24698_g1_i1:1-345(+)
MGNYHTRHPTRTSESRRGRNRFDTRKSNTRNIMSLSLTQIASSCFPRSSRPSGFLLRAAEERSRSTYEPMYHVMENGLSRTKAAVWVFGSGMVCTIGSFAVVAYKVYQDKPKKK